jgi:hypothetical protein
VENFRDLSLRVQRNLLIAKFEDSACLNLQIIIQQLARQA